MYVHVIQEQRFEASFNFAGGYFSTTKSSKSHKELNEGELF